jgi:SAM-dependent methyltransferase
MNELLIALQHLEAKSNEQWLASLNGRKIAELSFHDAQRGRESHELDANKKYYATTKLVHHYMDWWIQQNSQGKIFLDYACGNGTATIMAAHAGAELSIGLDISRVSVENGRRVAKQQGLNNALFVQGDCENTDLPPNSVDRVFCSGMLHHLDLSYALPELRRILKPGGKCLAAEALVYNPIIKLYRFLTPNLRTDWEKHHILSLRDVTFIRRFFDVKNVHYWHFASVATVPFRNSRVFPVVLRLADAIDSVILSVYPISLMAWMFTFEMVKRA